MTTSAQALNEMLAFASKNGKDNEYFTAVVARQLSLEGADATIEAARAAHLLATKVRDDIDAVELEDSSKNLLKRYFNPFNGLISLAHINMNIKSAKSHFLKAEHLVGLTNVHMALSGKIELAQLDSDTVSLAKSIREIIPQAAQSGLPEMGRRILVERLNQVAVALENFHFFGAEHLEKELEGLIGAIAVAMPDAEPEEEKMLRKAFAVSGKAMKGLRRINDGLGSLLGISEKGGQLLRLIADAS